MTQSPTPHADINAVLTHFHEKLAALFGNHLLGMYVIGSLALGDFNPKTSDIDFIAIIDNDIDDTQFRALAKLHADFAASDSKWAQKIEAVYITPNAFHAAPDKREYPQLEKGTTLFKAPLEDGWVFQLYTLRECPIIVAGDDPRTLIPAVDTSAMKPAVAVIAGTWLEQSRTDPKWLDWVRSRENQVFVVQTLCRLHYSLATGDVTSKPAAMRWAQKVMTPLWRTLVDDTLLSPRWQTLIDETLAKQHETTDISQAELEKTVAFVAYTAEQSR